jgi:RNA polymerase sigma-70 factor (ECF subfamily)
MVPGVAACGGASERRLIDRIAAGDDAALAEVYEEHGSLVFGLAMRVTRDRAVAEDVTQDVFVGLWRRPERFDPERGSLRALLAAMARNRAIDVMRSRGASLRREENEGRLAVAHGSVDGVEEHALRSERSAAVARALASLPPDQREAIDLAYYGGHTYREVAELLGIPEGTAKSRLRIGMQRLATCLEAEGIVSWT